jgi:chaperonin GroES
MPYRPRLENVFIWQLESEERSKGGIIIPDTAKERPLEGVVVAVGPGRWSSLAETVDAGTRHERREQKRMPMGVKEGDRVLFGRYVGEEVRIDGQTLRIVAEPELLAVVEP